MRRNLPDDWVCYYRTCHRCGARYHLSEGCTACSDDWQSDEDEEHAAADAADDERRCFARENGGYRWND